MFPTGLDDDPCGLPLLAIAVAWAGHRTVRSRPRAAAVGSFVGVVVFLAGVFAGVGTGDAPLGVLCTAGSMAGFSLAVSWVVLAATAAVWSVFATALRTVRRWLVGAATRWATCRAARRARATARRASARPYDAAAQQAAGDGETRTRAAAQKRREEARARVEIAFTLHAPELGARFTRAAFDEFVARYMGDDKTPEAVEARADQLDEVIRQHLAKARPASDTQSLDDLLSAYAARRRKIQASDLDPRDQETILIQLDEQRDRDVAKALREGRV